MKISASFWAPLFLSAALLAGCRAKTSLSSAASADPILVPAPMPESSFQVSARALQTEFEAGKPVEFSIEIKNISAESADLNFLSSQKFDFSATRAGEADATWSYGMNKRFAQAISTVKLEAGKSLIYKTTWNNPQTGTYAVRALIKANGGLEAAPFEIVVK